MGVIRCKACNVPKAALWIGDEYHGGCARRETLAADDWCCTSMRADLMEAALLRAVLPDAFDDDGRIKSGRIMDALKARDEALQRMARLRGPMLVDLSTQIPAPIKGKEKQR